MAAEKLTVGGGGCCRDLTVVRNLLTRIVSQGTSSSGIPLQGASSSIKHTEGGVLKLVVSKVGRLNLKKTKLSGSARRKLEKAWASQGCTGVYNTGAHGNTQAGCDPDQDD
jgi:hypothetical protein